MCAVNLNKKNWSRENLILTTCCVWLKNRLFLRTSKAPLQHPSPGQFEKNMPVQLLMNFRTRIVGNGLYSVIYSLKVQNID